MERLRRGVGAWMLVFATAALISGSTVSCGEATVPPLSTAPSTLIGPVSTGSSTPAGPASTESPSIPGTAPTGSATAGGPVGPLSSGYATVIGSATSDTSESKTHTTTKRVPTDLVGKTADAAEALLATAGTASTVAFREAEEADVGLVLEVDPAGGSVIAEGRSVVLLVGKPKESVERRVPMDLVGKLADAAQALLFGAGIPSTVTFREVEEADVGLVLEVDPVGGTLLAPGGSVHLLVGKVKEGLPPTPLGAEDLTTEIPEVP